MECEILNNPIKSRLMEVIHVDATLIGALDVYVRDYIGSTSMTRFTCNDGRLTFYADELHPFTGEHLIVYCIEVFPEQRRRGICTHSSAF